jgi:outer membrane protein assembly factor BamB
MGGLVALRYAVVASILAVAVSARAEQPEAVKGAADQWHQWRGPSGQGHVESAKVPLAWSETQNILWKTPLPGKGNSTPIIWGDRVFLTAASPSGNERFVLCIGAKDGKILWQRQAAKDSDPGKSHEWNGYASASCTTDGERVYAFFGTPGLFCYDMNGKLLWEHRFGIFTTETGWGVGASPFLYGDLVIQNCDNDGAKALPPGHKPEEAAPAALVALEKRTGEERWRTPRDQGRGFSTPRLVVTKNGRQELVLNGPLGVWAYDPAKGTELWHCNRTEPSDQARFGEPIPVSDGDTLYAPSGRPGPFQAIRLGGSGDVSKSNLIWEVSRKGHRDVSSQILVNNLIFAADKEGTLTCHDPADGKKLYAVRLNEGKSLASPISVRGKVLFLMDTGTTIVVEPQRTFKETGRNKLGEGAELEFEASPAVARDRLFLRSQTHLYCIGEK